MKTESEANLDKKLENISAKMTMDGKDILTFAVYPGKKWINFL